MKFTIDNRTRFPTRALRRYVVRAYRIARDAAGPTRTANFERQFDQIKITLARSNRWHGAATGHAHYFSPIAHVGIPDTGKGRNIARTIAHEFAHCLGMRHPEMTHGPLDSGWRSARIDGGEQDARVYGWADSIPLVARTPRPRSLPLDQRRVRDLMRTRAAIARWQTKAKRAANALKKLRVKERRLTRLTGDTP